MRWLTLVLVFIGCVPVFAWAQTGRGIVTAEAFVGRAHSVYIGTIQTLDSAEYKEQLDPHVYFGKTYKMGFEVKETIRGEVKSRLEIILLSQHSDYLEYLRLHHIELAIAIGKDCYVSDIGSELIVDVDGQKRLGETMQYRILQKLTVKGELGVGPDASQFNTSMDEGKMFDFNFNLLKSRDEVLKHFRAFAKKHREVFRMIWVGVPHPFGRLCGYTNAYMLVGFPVCDETKKTLQKMIDHPEAFLKKYASKDIDGDRREFISSGRKALDDFGKSQ